MKTFRKDLLTTLIEWYFTIFTVAIFVLLSGLIYWQMIIEHGIAKGIILSTVTIGFAIAFFFVYIAFVIAITSLLMYGSFLVFPVAFLYFIEGVITGEYLIWGLNPLLVLSISLVVSFWGYFNYRLGKTIFGDNWFFLDI